MNNHTESEGEVMIKKRNIRLSVESRRNSRRRYESRTDDERRMALAEFLKEEQGIDCTADDLESTGYYTYCDTEDNGWFIGTDEEADKFALEELRTLIDDGAMGNIIDTLSEYTEFWNVEGIRDWLLENAYDDEEAEEIENLDDYDVVNRYASICEDFNDPFLDQDAALEYICFNMYSRADSISDNNREFVFTDKRGNKWVIAHNDAFSM